MTQSKCLILAVAFIVCLCDVTESIQLSMDDIPKELQYLFTEEYENYEPSREYSAKYPYYHSGYDEDNRPVWVIELGRWDIRGAVQKGGEKKEEFDRYMNKTIYRVLKSVGERDENEEDSTKEMVLIIDMDGYSLQQLNSIPAVTYLVNLLRLIFGALSKFLHSAYGINTNFVAQALLNIVRPVLGPNFARVQVYGTDAKKFNLALRREIPSDQLPEWYGGDKDFKPVRVFG